MNDLEAVHRFGRSTLADGGGPFQIVERMLRVNRGPLFNVSWWRYGDRLSHMRG